MPASPQERSSHAQLAALARVAQEPSGAAMTARARQVFADSFFERTDPALPDQERRRQAAALKRAHYLKLSRQAVAARQRARHALADLSAAADELASAVLGGSV